MQGWFLGLILASLGVEMTPASEVGCAKNTVNTVVFVRFHFFHVFSELDDI